MYSPPWLWFEKMSWHFWILISLTCISLLLRCQQRSKVSNISSKFLLSHLHITQNIFLLIARERRSRGPCTSTVVLFIFTRLSRLYACAPLERTAYTISSLVVRIFIFKAELEKCYKCQKAITQRPLVVLDRHFIEANLSKTKTDGKILPSSDNSNKLGKAVTFISNMR